LRLAAVVAAAFGQLSWLAAPANLLLVPAFGALLASALALALWPRVPGAALLLELHRSFVMLVSAIGGLAERWPWLAPDPRDLPAPVRLGAAVVAAALLLNTCRALTIRPYVDV
jgi:hypothetical protein